jgi:putative phosphoribosyl transferase
MLRVRYYDPYFSSASRYRDGYFHQMTNTHLNDLPELRDQRYVFSNREEAGETLAMMLNAWRDSHALVLGIPAGGIPVAAVVAEQLNLPLGVAVASKVLLPWNTEVGYGAVAFDGSYWINAEYVAHFGLGEQDVEEGINEARVKVERRVQRFMKGQPIQDLRGRTVILVDDGIAAGSTLRVVIKALRKAKLETLIVAVPTAHTRSAHDIALLADELYVANLRGGLTYAVAEAYQQWRDVSEEEVDAILLRFNSSRSGI